MIGPPERAARPNDDMNITQMRQYTYGYLYVIAQSADPDYARQ